jgi:glyoxylase-like metal-dependent hydrolase (beta-lactamase superfamily II)
MTSILLTPSVLTVETFRAEGDGCLGYLVVDEPSGAALAIDPRLDQVSAIENAVTARGWRLMYVLDTHTHADHLSGAWALAARTGAQPIAHAASRATRIAARVTDGDTLELGHRRIRILAAPGHTPDSMALLVDGHLFTGDALFAGGAGRTDFPGGSALALFDTLRSLQALPAATVVHPGHDYTGRAVTTIGEELATNPVLREVDRSAFVARFGGRAAPPTNMAAIVRYNLGETDTATIPVTELDSRQAEGASPFLLDVRSPLEFESERIEGSVNVPLEELPARLDAVPSTGDVVLVCRTGTRATLAAETLARAGRRARVLEGGVLAWRRAGRPLREGRKRLAVDRQVQMIAGGMVLLGTALAALVSPWFLIVPAFFGAGLTFAGATGTCGLALLLLKMPWNRPRPAMEPAGAVCAAPGSPAPTCAAPDAQGWTARDLAARAPHDAHGARSRMNASA